ncbi:MAG TPA: hypothetical protein VHD61_02740 [Lacunisphaera sp.]|nr:hypothetical protein [Lacunisphaera sp.]
MTRSPDDTRFRARPVHPHQWLWEPLERDPAFVLRSMFGAKAVYLDGKLMLCFSAGEEPWDGLLVCTDQARHGALQADFPALVPHRILPKWLYLSGNTDAFDRVAPQLVALARSRDPRLGVVPAPKRRRRNKRERLR